MNKHPDVKESVVVACEDRPNDKRLLACVVMRRRPATARHELKLFLKQMLPDHMLPSANVILDGLPLTPSGKVDRQALPAPDRVHSKAAKALVAPRDELELQLTKTWEMERKLKKINLLKTDTIGNTTLTLVNLRDVVAVAQQLVNAGIHFYN